MESKFKAQRMRSVECLVVRVLWAVNWLLGFVPLPPISELHWFLLAVVVRSLWFLYFMYLVFLGIGYLFTDTLTISYISGTVLYLCNSMLGVVILVESMLKHRAHVRLEDLRFQLELKILRLGRARDCRRAVHVLVLLGTELASDILKTWVNTHCSISPVHLNSLANKWFVRFRYVQVLWQVKELNHRAIQLRYSILDLATGNDVWPYGLPNWKRLQALRACYDCIYRCYETFSDCYGWGILCLQLMCSLEFVVNAYWILTEAYDTQRLYMFIFNGNTCFALGVLIVALFWYGDASENNLRFSNRLEMAQEFFHIFPACLGVQWCSWLHRLQFLPFCVWLFWIPLVGTAFMQSITSFHNCNFDCQLAAVIYTMITVSHALILIDTLFKRRALRQLDLQLDTTQPIQINQRKGFICVCAVFVLVQSLSLGLRLSLNRQKYMIVYYLGMPSVWAVQLKLITLLFETLKLNDRVRDMQKGLQQLAGKPGQNKQLLAEEQVIHFKAQYKQLHQIFVQLNLAYGNSLLVIFIVLFFDFIFNAYWLCKLALVSFQNHGYLYFYLSYLLNLAVMLSVTCWHCQLSINHSRQIGCLIPKLAKPLASKRYNDLVSEFMLQALHQRFVVTAKDFFNLNLHLLSSMLGAVVTYLVILIQFMFAERSARISSEGRAATNEL